MRRAAGEPSAGPRLRQHRRAAAILPVNYVLWNGKILFRTAPGTKLTAALMGAVVGFEVDDMSDDHSGGWSVLVVGHAIEIRDLEELQRVRDLPLETWAPGQRDRFVNIATENVSGRAFCRTPT